MEIFKLKQKVNKAAGAGNAEYAALAAEIRSTTLGIIDEAYELTEENEITDEDYYKISQICKYFFEYFSQNYEELKLRQEVEQVTEYIAEIGAKLGRKQGEEIGRKRGEEIGRKRGEEIGRKKSIDVMNEYLLNAGVDPALLKKAAELALMEGKSTEN